MVAAKRTPATPKTRTLIIERAGKGRLQITIPANAKVTYAAVNPQRGYGGPEGQHVLRIYQGTIQTAVFHGVIEFRDTAYPIKVERIETVDHEDMVRVDGKTKKRNIDYRQTGVFVDMEDDF